MRSPLGKAGWPLVVNEPRPITNRLGLTIEASPFPIFSYRSSAPSTVYYFLLSKLKIARFFVCTGNIVISKPK